MSDDCRRDGKAVFFFQCLPETGNGYLLKAEGDVECELLLIFASAV